MIELFVSDFSYDDCLTYKIKKSDTPESVALELGVELYELRSYHNMHCPITNAFGLQFSFAFIGIFGVLIAFMVSKIRTTN